MPYNELLGPKLQEVAQNLAVMYEKGDKGANTELHVWQNGLTPSLYRKVLNEMQDSNEAARKDDPTLPILTIDGAGGVAARKPSREEIATKRFNDTASGR